MTPTREQLASIEDEVVDCAEKLDAALATIDGDYCTWTTGPEVKSVRDQLRNLAACLAAPPPEPQAMPPIEVGDVVTQMGHGRPVAVLVEHVDDHLLTVRHLAHSETIHYKRALAIYKPVWTREPRR